MENKLEELKRIENKYKTIKSDFIRNQSIWDEIASNINSYKGEKQKYWIDIMNIHLKK